ncbi:MAG: hypothetical protein UU76_C0003G0009 [Parcubacteria group bacterium GW2011_GWC1_41_7]|nr:MAG: hypothetical protein UU76_C0003G0009 [Parcubacteria group bacterium GW2011_GWC1_41_7]
MRRHHPIRTALGFLLIIGIAVLYVKERNKNEPLRQELSTLQSDVSRLRQENTLLKQRSLYLRNQENIQKEARDKFNLSEPGEKVIIFPSGW